MAQERLEQEKTDEKARELRKKSSAHIDFEYRSNESQNLVNELGRLEAIELENAEKQRTVEHRLAELVDNKKEYEQAIEEVNCTIQVNQEQHSVIMQEMHQKLQLSMSDMAQYRQKSTRIIAEIKDASAAHLNHWEIFFSPANAN